jgi:PilZ domain
MAEFTRSIVTRLRQLVGDRRHSSRRKVCLPFSLSLVSLTRNLNGQRRINRMNGHTVDLSQRGLGLIVPRITLGEHHLVGENRSLNVKLELPNGPVEMKVLPVRYEALERDETDTEYLIGVRIVEMPDEDREKFSEYLTTRRE